MKRPLRLQEEPEYEIVNKEAWQRVENLCAPYEVTKNKNWKRTGKATIFLPNGAQGIKEGDYLVKFSSTAISISQ